MHHIFQKCFINFALLVYVCTGQSLRRNDVKNNLFLQKFSTATPALTAAKPAAGLKSGVPVDEDYLQPKTMVRGGPYHRVHPKPNSDKIVNYLMSKQNAIDKTKNDLKPKSVLEKKNEKSEGHCESYGFVSTLLHEVLEIINLFILKSIESLSNDTDSGYEQDHEQSGKELKLLVIPEKETKDEIFAPLSYVLDPNSKENDEDVGQETYYIPIEFTFDSKNDDGGLKQSVYMNSKNKKLVEADDLPFSFNIEFTK